MIGIRLDEWRVEGLEITWMQLPNRYGFQGWAYWEDGWKPFLSRAGRLED